MHAFDTVNGWRYTGRTDIWEQTSEQMGYRWCTWPNAFQNGLLLDVRKAYGVSQREAGIRIGRMAHGFPVCLKAYANWENGKTQPKKRYRRALLRWIERAAQNGKDNSNEETVS